MPSQEHVLATSNTFHSSQIASIAELRSSLEAVSKTHAEYVERAALDSSSHRTVVERLKQRVESCDEDRGSIRSEIRESMNTVEQIRSQLCNLATDVSALSRVSQD